MIVLTTIKIYINLSILHIYELSHGTLISTFCCFYITCIQNYIYQSYIYIHLFSISTFFSSFSITCIQNNKIKKIKDFLGFGAPTLKSYGCCYCMTSNHLLMVITSSTTCIHKNVIRFQNEIIQGLNDLIHVLQSTNSKV